MPLRSHNLHELMFGRHLFLHDGARATSSLEIPADEVKNKTTALSFDIPPKLAKMLLEHRDRIAPKVIGRRPERVFINADGSPKSQPMVAILIKTYLSKRAGIVMTPHQFRHLGAKIMLDGHDDDDHINLNTRLCPSTRFVRATFLIDENFQPGK